MRACNSWQAPSLTSRPLTLRTHPSSLIHLPLPCLSGYQTSSLLNLLTQQFPSTVGTFDQTTFHHSMDRKWDGVTMSGVDVYFAPMSSRMTVASVFPRCCVFDDFWELSSQQIKWQWRRERNGCTIALQTTNITVKATLFKIVLQSGICSYWDCLWRSVTHLNTHPHTLTLTYTYLKRVIPTLT